MPTQHGNYHKDDKYYPSYAIVYFMVLSLAERLGCQVAECDYTGQIYSRPVITCNFNLDRLWTFSHQIWVYLDPSLNHRTQLIAMMLDDNNNVLACTIICKYI